MANVNPGPASVQTVNATASVNAPQGGPTGVTFANLPTGSQLGETAFTSDQGFVVWNGTSWSPYTTAANVTTAISISKNQLRLLAVGKSLNVNAIGDIGVLPIIGSTRWNIQAVVGANLSANAGTSVAIAICSATAGAAVTVVAPQILSGLVAYGGVTVAYRFTVQNVSFAGSGTTIYVNCQTTAGAACTLDVLVYGYDLSV